MKRNMGTIDRIIRAILAVTVGVLFFFNQITGTAAIILGALALIFLVTSIIGFCPLYVPFHWKTCREGKC